MKLIKNRISIIVVASILLTVSSCQKDNFSVTPPGANFDPVGVHATMTIKQFKDAYFFPNINTIYATPLLLPMNNIILSGIINADDKSGSFYKVLSFQDSTGGIQLKIDGSNLYDDYPIGRRIYVKCDSLYLMNYKGTLEIGGYIDYYATPTSATPTTISIGGILGANLPKIITKGKWGLADSIIPLHLTLNDISNFTSSAQNWYVQSSLIQIDDAQFLPTDTNKLFADAVNKNFGNRYFGDCIGGPALEVSTSGYAYFANQNPPTGHGTIRGIYAMYRKTPTSSPYQQITIRDLNDINMSGPRCH